MAMPEPTLATPQTLEQVIAIAQEAGSILRRMYRESPHVWEKAPGDLLTEADLAANAHIVQRLGELFPHTVVWSEEGDVPPDTGARLWLIDPLDGTSNFAHRFPSFVVSIALWEEGAFTLGVVYDPLREDTFAAVRGGGATLNGRPIQVSARERLTESIVGCDWTRGPARRTLLALVTDIGMDVHALRVIGAAALSIAYVAAGWMDGYFNARLQPWDYAAGAVILTEAGGHIADWTGKPVGLRPTPIVCGNAHIFRLLQPRVGRVYWGDKGDTRDA